MALTGSWCLLFHDERLAKPQKLSPGWREIETLTLIRLRDVMSYSAASGVSDSGEKSGQEYLPRLLGSRSWTTSDAPSSDFNLLRNDVPERIEYRNQ